jgi:hypothetical protein
MPTDPTPNLNIARLDEGESGVVRFNDAFNIMDILVMGAVKDKDLTAPPGSEAEGDRYIVGASATGAWAGEDNNIAGYYGGAYIFVTAKEGMRVWVDDEDKLYRFNGTSWAEFGGSGATVFTDLSDVPSSYSGAGLDVVRVNAGETALEFATVATTFVGLTDTPANYTSSARKPVRVNATPNALEFGNETKAGAIHFESPAANDEFLMFFTNVAVTVQESRGVKSSGGTNFVYNIRHSTTRSAAGNSVFSSNVTVTSTGTGNAGGATSDPTIPANSWVWVQIISVSGTVDWGEVTLEFTED